MYVNIIVECSVASMTLLLLELCIVCLSLSKPRRNYNSWRTCLNLISSLNIMLWKRASKSGILNSSIQNGVHTVYQFILVVKYFHENAPKFLLRRNIFANDPCGHVERCGMAALSWDKFCKWRVNCEIHENFSPPK